VGSTIPILPLGGSVVNLTPWLLQRLTELNPTQYWRDLERMAWGLSTSGLIGFSKKYQYFIFGNMERLEIEK
jgi:hypothetical protein